MSYCDLRKYMTDSEQLRLAPEGTHECAASLRRRRCCRARCPRSLRSRAEIRGPRAREREQLVNKIDIKMRGSEILRREAGEFPVNLNLFQSGEIDVEKLPVHPRDLQAVTPEHL